MRKIFQDPTATQEIYGKDDNRATKEDINQLSERIDNTVQSLANLADALSNYEQQLEESVNTEQITALNAAIETIQATSADLSTISAQNLTVNVKATISNLEAAIASIASLEAQIAKATTLIATSATLDTATITTLNATTANITNWVLQNISAQSITTGTGAFDTATVGALTVSGNATITNNASVGGNLSVTEKIEADTLEVEGAKTKELGIENIHWLGTQALVDVEEFYVNVPHFENGQYYVQILDNNVPIVTLEILNSVDNYLVRWSQLNLDNLIYIYKVGTGNAAELSFCIENTTGHALELRYATTAVTENVSAPSIESAAPEEYESEYEVVYKDGSKFYKNVDFANQGGTVGILHVFETDDWEDTTDEYQYDTTENLNVNTYKPDQSVNKDDEVEFAKVSTTFLDVREFTTDNFASTSLQLPNTIDLTKFDDGSIIVLRNSSTAATPQPSTAYIKRTINGNPVLLPIPALNGVNNQTNIPLIWDATNHCLSEANNVVVPNDLSVTNDATIGGDLSVAGDTTLAKVNVTDEATFADKVDMADDLTVAGDLFVKGTTHTTGVEDITATSDLITLRANNNTALTSGQVSGVVVNKYNGTEDLALVTDNDGTLRVGTGAGTDTTYNKIALKAADGKYYSYDDTDPDDIQYTLMNPQPSGTMTAWTNRQVITGYTLYVTATFTVIDKTSLVPLLGRAEESNLSDKQILQWDATGVKATGIPSPENGMFLKATVNPGADYHWSAITFAATGYSEVLYAFPESDDTTFGNLILKEGTKPTPVPSQATTVTHTYTDYFYDNSLDEVVAEDNGTYYRVVFNADGTCTVTNTVIASTSPVACTITSEKIDNVHGTAYQWAEAGGRGVTFKGTMAQYEVAKLIPFGQEGHIPSGSLVIITDEPDYVRGEDR